MCSEVRRSVCDCLTNGGELLVYGMTWTVVHWNKGGAETEEVQFWTEKKFERELLYKHNIDNVYV